MDAANLLNTVFSAPAAKGGKPGAGNDEASSLFASLLTAPAAQTQPAKTAATSGATSGATVSDSSETAQTGKSGTPGSAFPSGESSVTETPIALPAGPPDETDDGDGDVVVTTADATFSGPGYQVWSDEELAARAETQAAHRANMEAMTTNRWAKVFVRGKTGLGDFKGTAQDSMALNSFAHKMLNNMAARDAHQAAAADRRAVFANVTISPDGAQPNYHPTFSGAAAAQGEGAGNQGLAIQNPAGPGTGAAAQGGATPIVDTKPVPGNLTGFDSHLAEKSGLAAQTSTTVNVPPPALKAPQVTVTRAQSPAVASQAASADGQAVANTKPVPGNLTGFDSHLATQNPAQKSALAAAAGVTDQAFKAANVTVTNTQSASDSAQNAANGAAKTQAHGQPQGQPQTASGNAGAPDAANKAQVQQAAVPADPAAAKLNLSVRQNAAAPASTPGAQLAAAHAAAAAQRVNPTHNNTVNRSDNGGAAQTQPGATSTSTAQPGVAPLLQNAVTAAAFADKPGDLGDQTADPEGDLDLNGLSRGGETARADRAAAQQAQTRPGPHVDAAAVAKLAKNIAKQAGNGARRFEIRMDPPELGKIEVKLEIGPDKKAHAMLLAERPETLADLQRSARALQRALADSGLELHQDGIKFGLSQDGGSNNSGGFGERSPGGRSPLSAGPAIAESTSEAPRPVAERSIDAFGFRLAARSGANVRI